MGRWSIIMYVNSSCFTHDIYHHEPHSENCIAILYCELVNMKLLKLLNTLSGQGLPIMYCLMLHYTQSRTLRWGKEPCTRYCKFTTLCCSGAFKKSLHAVHLNQTPSSPLPLIMMTLSPLLIKLGWVSTAAFRFWYVFTVRCYRVFQAHFFLRKHFSFKRKLW